MFFDAVRFRDDVPVIVEGVKYNTSHDLAIKTKEAMADYDNMLISMAHKYGLEYELNQYLKLEL